MTANYFQGDFARGQRTFEPWVIVVGSFATTCRTIKPFA
jgi:hypothetical protein